MINTLLCDAHRVRVHDFAQRVAALLRAVLGRRPSGGEFGEHASGVGSDCQVVGVYGWGGTVRNEPCLERWKSAGTSQGAR